MHVALSIKNFKDTKTCPQRSNTCTHTHTHLFNGPFSRTTRVRRYQKGKTNQDFTESRDSEWLWHQLGHMQVCTLLQTAQFFTGRMPFLPPNQQCQSTEGIHIIKGKLAPLLSIAACTDYTMPEYGAYLHFTGLGLAVGLHPALSTADHTSSITCHYLPSFYNGIKLYCLVREVNIHT